ncbi:hypothetical protein AB0395_27445 [Streptosporangium sp. NPDC051023]|uniref:hypothetical protein n=1 Tax=Streptosporangium sp. NPDC051023 TaxID=3155410 RepID=UPI003450EFD2
MLRKYEVNGITVLGYGVDCQALARGEDPFESEAEHYELDGQPPVARPGNWHAPYTRT